MATSARGRDEDEKIRRFMLVGQCADRWEILHQLGRDKMTRMIAHRRIAILTGLFALAMLCVALLRLAEIRSPEPGGIATPLYVAVTILFAVLLVRAGAPMGRLGFGVSTTVSRITALALLGIALRQVLSYTLDPVIEGALGADRDLTRFADLADSPGALARLLVLSWTFAALGEELAFRIVMMRGLIVSFGGGRTAAIAALVVQAVIFGLLHLYQGPAGVYGALVSGLVYGVVTLLARGSIWPAAIAHGANNTIGILALYYGVTG